MQPFSVAVNWKTSSCRENMRSFSFYASRPVFEVPSLERQLCIITRRLVNLRVTPSAFSRSMEQLAGYLSGYPQSRCLSGGRPPFLLTAPFSPGPVSTTTMQLLPPTLLHRSLSSSCRRSLIDPRASAWLLWKQAHAERRGATAKR